MNKCCCCLCAKNLDNANEKWKMEKKKAETAEELQETTALMGKGRRDVGGI